VYASRAYLARGARGGAGGAGDLRSERFVAYDDAYGEIPERVWMTRQGLDEAVVIRTSSTRGLVHAVRAGAGMGLLPAFLTRDIPDLVAVEAPPVPSRGVWLVTHEDLRRRPTVRAVWEHLVETFAKV
jgi:DNA-binding transcriptional LysR family regulator